MRRNRMALDEIAFRPRVLRNVAKVDASVEAIRPQDAAAGGAWRRSARSKSSIPKARASVARAAPARFGAAHMLSSVSRARPREGRRGRARCVADVPALCPRRRRLCRGLRQPRGRNGYTAFCLTVDTAHYSRRERDIAKRYVRESRLRATGGDFQKGLEWRTVKLIKDKYKIPLVIKGIATAEDATIALDHGVDWIYVSNHGGRQLDHGRGSMHVLPEIVEAVKGRAKIMVDGSILPRHRHRQGDRAGADLVGIGRLQCWALAAGGETGDRADAGAAGGRSDPLPRPARRHRISPSSTNPICIRRGRPTCPTSSAPSRCWTSSRIGIETAVHDGVTTRSLPGAADALLFDLGRVVIDIDFSRALACWAGHAGCEPGAICRSRFRCARGFRRHETGEVSDAEFFAGLRASLGIAISDAQFLEGWNAIFAGEMPGIDALLARAAKRLPLYAFSNTNAPHVEHFSRALCRRARPFPRNLPVLGDRASETRRGAPMIMWCKAIGVPAERIVFFDDLAENIEGARSAGLDGRSRDIAR